MEQDAQFEADCLAHEEEVNKLLTVAAGLSGQLGDISHQGGIAQYHVIAAESILPGILLDNYPDGGFTLKPSEQNLTIAIESLTAATISAIVVAIAAVIGLIIKIIQWVTGKNKTSNETTEKVRVVKETVYKETVYAVDKNDILLRDLDFIGNHRELLEQMDLESFVNKLKLITGKDYAHSDSILKIIIHSRNDVVDMCNSEVMEKIPYSFFEMGTNPNRSKYFPVFTTLSQEMDDILEGILEAISLTEKISFDKDTAVHKFSEERSSQLYQDPEAVAQKLTITSIITTTYNTILHAIGKQNVHELSSSEIANGVSAFQTMLVEESRYGSAKNHSDVKPILIGKNTENLQRVCEGIDDMYLHAFTVTSQQQTRLDALEKKFETMLKSKYHADYVDSKYKIRPGRVVKYGHDRASKEYDIAKRVYKHNMEQIQIALRVLRSCIGARTFYVEHVLYHSLFVYRGVIKRYVEYMHLIDALAEKIKKKVEAEKSTSK